MANSKENYWRDLVSKTIEFNLVYTCSYFHVTFSLVFITALVSSWSPLPYITTFKSTFDRIEATPVDRENKSELLKSAPKQSTPATAFACISESGVDLSSGAKSIEGLGGGTSPSDSLFSIPVTFCLLFAGRLGFIGWFLSAKAVFKLLSRNLDLSFGFKPENSFLDCFVSFWSSSFIRSSSLLNDFPPNDISFQVTYWWSTEYLESVFDSSIPPFHVKQKKNNQL